MLFGFPNRCCFLTLFLLTGSLHSGMSQAPSSLHWTTTDGDQFLEADAASLHLKPRTTGTSPGVVNATAKLSLPDTQKWQVSFDIRFGVLRDQASSFHLSRGGKDLGRVAADGFFKQMGVFLGKDNEVAAPGADTNWHHFTYVSDGSTLTVRLDDRQVGSGAAQSAPDSLILGNGQDMRVPCHQEGVWVRNILASATVDVIPQQAPPATASPVPKGGYAPLEKNGVDKAPMTQLPMPNVEPAIQAKVEPAIRADEIIANTKQALSDGLVNVKAGNWTDAYDSSTIVDFAVTNSSKKAIAFWTTPTIKFGDGTEGAIQSGSVSGTPFRSYASQVRQIISRAMSGEPGFQFTGQNQGVEVSKIEDTVIKPGQTLYFHCGTYKGNAASLPVGVRFKGGGWDVITLKVFLTRNDAPY